MRLFISLNTDKATKDKISEIQKNINKEISGINSDFLNSIKWEPVDKFHMTLFFIGNVNESKLKEIDSRLIKLESDFPFEEIKFSFKGFNAFPKLKYPRVLILEFNNDDKKVFDLSEKINLSLKEIGLINDKPFRPHITIARVRREHKINLINLENKLETAIDFSVNKFHLMESKLNSKGSQYSVIREYKLRASD